jgi:hypothetical protein
MFWLIACLTPYPIVPGTGDCALFADVDQDGFGDPQACLPPGDSTGVANKDDCNDQDALTYPGAPEFCDGLDQDCDKIPDNNAQDAEQHFVDSDGDSFGDPLRQERICPMDGWVLVDGDCDDTDPQIYPNAPEYCDGVDQDCNDLVDDNPNDGQTWYLDQDEDGYGRKQDFSEELCTAPPGYVASPDDCDDQDYNVNPGQTYFFEYPSLSGNWDYNCDESDETGYPNDPQCDSDGNLIIDGFVFGPPECGDSALMADYCFLGSAVGAFDYRIQPCR